MPVTDADVQVDKYVLHELSQLEQEAIEAYDAFAFNRGRRRFSGR